MSDSSAFRFRVAIMLVPILLAGSAASAPSAWSDAIRVVGGDGDGHVLQFRLDNERACTLQFDYFTGGQHGFKALLGIGPSESRKALGEAAFLTRGPNQTLGAWAGPLSVSAAPAAGTPGGFRYTMDGPAPAGVYAVVLGLDAESSISSYYDAHVTCEQPLHDVHVVPTRFQHYSHLVMSGGAGAALLPDTGFPHATLNRSMQVPFEEEGLAVSQAGPCGGYARVGVLSNAGYTEASTLSSTTACAAVRVVEAVRAPQDVVLSFEGAMAEGSAAAWTMHWPIGALSFMD